MPVISFEIRNHVRAPNCRELDFTMRSLGLQQIIDTPTCISFCNGSEIKSKIDLISTNSELDWNLSDHLAVMTTRKKSWVNPLLTVEKGHFSFESSSHIFNFKFGYFSYLFDNSFQYQSYFFRI